MIIVELIEENTRERRYSDKDVMIKQIETSNLYEDAVDVIPCKYTYEETDIPIEHIEPAEELNIEEVMANRFMPNQFKPIIDNEQ